MKLKIENGTLKIDLNELVEALDQEQRTALARHLVADELLFRAVLECVSDEGRFGHFFTDDGDGDWWFSPEKLLELREKLIPLLPAIARGAVEEALRQRNQAKADGKRHHDWAYNLYHAWPELYLDRRPRGPDGWKPAAPPSKEEIDALLAAETGS